MDPDPAPFLERFRQLGPVKLSKVIPDGAAPGSVQDVRGPRTLGEPLPLRTERLADMPGSPGPARRPAAPPPRGGAYMVLTSVPKAGSSSEHRVLSSGPERNPVGSSWSVCCHGGGTLVTGERLLAVEVVLTLQRSVFSLF